MEIEQFKEVFYSQLEFYNTLDFYMKQGLNFSEFSPKLIDAAEDVFDSYLKAYFSQEIIDFINWYLYECIPRDKETYYYSFLGNQIRVSNDDEFFNIIEEKIVNTKKFTLSVDEYFVGKTTHTFVIPESSVEKAAAKVLEYYSLGNLSEKSLETSEVEFYESLPRNIGNISALEVYDKKGNLILSHE